MHRAGIMLLLFAVGSFAQSPEEKPVPKENPYQSEADVARGKQLFLGHCAPCHGPAGAGGKGANLARPSLRRAADDQALFHLLRDGVPGTEMPGAWEMIDHEVWQVAAFVRTLGRAAGEEPVAGDRTHGEQLVRTKGNCMQCHTIGSEGGTMGPPLTEIGERRSAAFLRKTLLDPQSTIPEDYMFLELVTKDKKKMSGIRLAEDTYTVQVHDLSGRLHSFWKSELAEIHRDRAHTPMPGFRSVYSDAELDDVVAYLVSLRGAQ
jgi:putative heme-binding domain-containing protein